MHLKSILGVLLSLTENAAKVHLIFELKNFKLFLTTFNKNEWFSFSFGVFQNTFQTRKDSYEYYFVLK